MIIIKLADTMAGKLRQIQITFTRTVILSLVVLLILGLLSTHKKHLSNHLVNFTVEWNSVFYTARSPCFTVGFANQKRNGLGNHLFYYAVVMYAAWLTGRKPIMMTSSKKVTELDKAFDLDIDRLHDNVQCPVKEFTHKVVYAFNVDINFLNDVDESVSVLFRGHSCSWKYTQPIEDQLRRKLRFRRHLTVFANKFLSANVPTGWNMSTFVHVGIHVRRGDFLSNWAVRRGFTVANKQYLKRAMTYFVKRFTQVQFIVASNDIAWSRNNINSSSFDQTRVNITFSVGHSTQQDLALLASCNHMIMTTGTFGWWAAWLANGTTIYYKNFPRRGTRLWLRSRLSDYFPPKWIGM